MLRSQRAIFDPMSLKMAKPREGLRIFLLVNCRPTDLRRDPGVMRIMELTLYRNLTQIQSSSLLQYYKWHPAVRFSRDHNWGFCFIAMSCDGRGVVLQQSMPLPNFGSSLPTFWIGYAPTVREKIEMRGKTGKISHERNERRQEAGS